jgi:hypothetical protein
MFLAMGVPVIARYQRSFEFLERYQCGVLVKNENEFVYAVGYIRDKLQEMKANALICAKEYINTSDKYRTLVENLNKINSKLTK